MSFRGLWVISNMSPEAQLIAYAKKLKADKLVSIACNKGSLSLRRGTSIYATPSGLDYDELRVQDITVLRLDGEVQQAVHKISMDTSFHLAIYQSRADVNAITHTHSRYATALALAGKGLPMVTFGVHLQLKKPVQCADFYVPDDPRVNQSIIEHLGGGNAVLLRNHGSITVGTDIQKAYENMVFLEETCESYVHALLLDQVNALNL